MSMPGLLPRSVGFVCRSCQLKQVKVPLRLASTIALSVPASRNKTNSLASPKKSSRRWQASSFAATLPSATKTRASKPSTAVPASTKPATSLRTDPNPTKTLSEIRHDVSTIKSTNVVPEELVVLQVVNRIYEFSNVITFGQSEQPNEAEIEESNSGASSILNDLDESGRGGKRTSSRSATGTAGMSLSFRTKAADTIADLIYDLVRDPKIFISPTILNVYTRVQCLLGKPEYLPEIFYFYANKPIPRPNTSDPITYKDPSPNSPKNAIPLDLADAALECAIQRHDMSLAIAIIDTTVGTRAYRISKLFRKATGPALAVSACPVIAYAGATWLSTYQNVWDVEMAKYTAMAGAMAYIGTLSTIGFIAVTTWNDQMQRVTWALGTPLTQRWLREEERSYFDRVALAWGFQERWRRGEEQGEEWEALRETVGQRSMLLDRTELMDGME